MTKTTVKPKKKESAIIKKAEILNKIAIRDKIDVIWCIISLFSNFVDYPMCFISLIIMQQCKSKTNMYLCAGASILYFATTVVKSPFYIPYMGFTIIYVISEYLLENNIGKIKSSHIATLTFVASKLYLLSFGFQTIYWMLFALEISCFIFLPSCITNGLKVLKKNYYYMNAIEIFDVVCILIVLAISVESIKITGILPAVSLLLGISILYKEKGNMIVSMASAMCMFFFLLPLEEFRLLFIGFFMIYLSNAALNIEGNKKYILICSTAIIVSCLFIVEFNSIIFLTTTAIAVTISFLLDKTTIILPVTPQPQQIDLTTEVGYINLMNKLEKLNRCYRFIGHTVIDISNLLTKDAVPQEIESMVANQICRKCKNNIYCWQENYSFTQKQFSSYIVALKKNIQPKFDDRFYSICSNTHQIQQEFLKTNRLISTQKVVQSASLHNQRILQNQFLIMAQCLKEITYQTNKQGVPNVTITSEMNTYLKNAGKKVNYCICYQNGNRCVINTNDYLEETDLFKIKNKLELLYKERFNLPDKENDESSVTYTFSQISMYYAQSCVRSKSKYDVCGDSCAIFNADEYTYVMLADGMGTGSFAAAESKTAISMLESLLSAQVNIETAIEIVNIALNLKGTGQSCVSLDILRINLNNGKCSIYKVGGAESLVMTKNNATRIYKDSLPIGILKDVNISTQSFLLNNGEMVAVLSDGVEVSDDILGRLNMMGINYSCEEVADYILNKCGQSDDATVAVVKMMRV